MTIGVKGLLLFLLPWHLITEYASSCPDQTCWHGWERDKGRGKGDKWGGSVPRGLQLFQSELLRGENHGPRSCWVRQRSPTDKARPPEFWRIIFPFCRHPGYWVSGVVSALWSDTDLSSWLLFAWFADSCSVKQKLSILSIISDSDLLLGKCN